MSKTKYYIFISIIIFFGCNQNNILDFNEKVLVEEINFSLDSLITDIQFVALETNENNLISEIDKLIIKNNRLYILCKRGLAMGVYVFNEDGKFIFSIKNQGKGPGEYLQINELLINENIEIYDPQKKKILKYNIDNGKFIEEYDFKFLAREFEKENNNIYLNTIANKDQKMLNIKTPRKDFFMFTKEDYKMNMENQLVKTNNNIYWIDPLRMCLYLLKDGLIIPKYAFDFKNKLLNDNDIRNLSLAQINDMGKAIFLSNICETGKFILADFSIYKTPYKLIFYKDIKRAFSINMFRSKSILMFSSQLTSSKDYVYSSLDAVYASEYYEYLIEKNNRSIPPVLKSIKNNDNPILIKFRIKDEIYK